VTVQRRFAITSSCGKKVRVVYLIKLTFQAKGYRVCKENVALNLFFFLFAETFLSFVRNSLKTSVIFSFSDIFF